MAIGVLLATGTGAAFPEADFGTLPVTPHAMPNIGIGPPAALPVRPRYR
jgi:hypothetical protein